MSQLLCIKIISINIIIIIIQQSKILIYVNFFIFRVFLPCFVTPELTEPRYVIVRVGCFDPRQYSVIDILRANLLLLDIYMLEDDIGIINGLRIFMDFSGHTMAHVPSPIVIKQMLLTLIDVYPNRIKNLTFLNIPTYFEIIFKLIQPFLSDKLKSRVSLVLFIFYRY